jgi:hypothetical protein
MASQQLTVKEIKRASVGPDGATIGVNTESGLIDLYLPAPSLEIFASKVTQLLQAQRTRATGVQKVRAHRIARTMVSTTKDGKLLMTVQEPTGLVHSFLLSRKMARELGADLIEQG